MTGSPRWCDLCQGWGDHHSDRHPDGRVIMLHIPARWPAWWWCLGYRLGRRRARKVHVGFDPTEFNARVEEIRDRLRDR